MATMKVVLDACGGQIGEDNYAIVINKCSPQFMKKIVNVPDAKVRWMASFQEACDSNGIPATKHFHFAPFEPSLWEQDDLIVELNKSTNQALHQLPIVNIDARNVEELNVEDWLEIKKKMELTIDT